jgi:hypothetical protein
LLRLQTAHSPSNGEFMPTDQSFITQVIEVIAWPLVVLTVVLLFRRQWRQLIGQLRSVRIGPGSFEVETALQEASSEASGDRKSRPEDCDGDLSCGEDCDPDVVVLTAWNHLSVRLQFAYLRQHGFDNATSSARQQIEQLRSTGIIDARTARMIDALRRARNAAAFDHSGRARLSICQALRFQVLASEAVQRLDIATGK